MFWVTVAKFIQINETIFYITGTLQLLTIHLDLCVTLYDAQTPIMGMA